MKLNGKFARKLAAEGIVLLKNEGLLPLAVSAPVALFGNGAVQTIKGGTGSGDVNNTRNVSIYKGLKDAGVCVTSGEWIKDYQKRYEDARNTWKEKVLKDAEEVDNPFDAYAKKSIFNARRAGYHNRRYKRCHYSNLCNQPYFW